MPAESSSRSTAPTTPDGVDQAPLESSPRVYWVTWATLLGLTAIMLAVDSAAIARPVLIAVLLAAMLVKVALISGNFMHLRQAHAGLVWTFVGGLLLTGLILYVLIVPDALRIHEMVTRR